MTTPDIPGYKNLRKWKQGGMGVLYRGKDEKTDEQVVIKTMKIPETEDELQQLPYMSGLFRSDTEIPTTVKHEHILGAIAHGYVILEGYELPYLVYPYIKNGSLQDLMNSERPWDNLAWSLSQIVDIIVQAAKGLFYLHSRQPIIAHLDVKPGNFLWRPEETKGDSRRVHLWLSDFGIARWEKDASYITRPIGTLQYMAPEQFEGHITHTADQYALAIVARYLLTGCSPPHTEYQPPSPATFRNPPPTRLNPDRLHSEEIDIALLRALSDNPEERFQDILNFAQALKRAILQQEYPSSSFTPTILSSQDALRSPDFYNERTEPNPVIDQSQRDLAPAAPELPIDHRQFQFQGSMAFPDIPLEPLPEHHFVDKPVPPHSRPTPIETNSHVVPLPYFPLQALSRVTLPDRPTMFSWSPDGQYLVCGFYEDVPRLIHLDERIEVLTAISRGHLACWSPDSRYLAISSYDRNAHKAAVHLWDRTTGRSTLIHIFRSDTPVDGLAWSIYGQLAVWRETELLIYSIPVQSQLLQFPPISKSVSLMNMQCGNIGTLQWSPDGSLLAAGAQNGALVLWDSDSQQIQMDVPVSTKERIYSLAWFPDSTLLAVAYRSRRVVFWDARAKREMKTWKGFPGPPLMLSILLDPLTLTIATENSLLFGSPGEQAPSMYHSGQLLAVWSTKSKLATLDVYNDTTLIIWQR